MKFKVLNEYKYASEILDGEQVIRPKLALGDDKSYDYSSNKNLNMFIYDQWTDSMITFRAFLTNFIIDFNVEYKEEETTEGSAPKNPKDFSCKYTVGLVVPAATLEEAEINDARAVEFTNMVVGDRKVIGDRLSSVARPKRVLLSNLIHNGTFTEGLKITGKKDVQRFGLRSYIGRGNWEPVVETGFFERDGFLFAKEYSINLDLNVYFTRDPQISSKRYIEGFRNGSYGGSDIQTWPFGV